MPSEYVCVALMPILFRYCWVSYEMSYLDWGNLFFVSSDIDSYEHMNMIRIVYFYFIAVYRTAGISLKLSLFKRKKSS